MKVFVALLIVLLAIVAPVAAASYVFFGFLPGVVTSTQMQYHSTAMTVAIALLVIVGFIIIWTLLISVALRIRNVFRRRDTADDASSGLLSQRP